MNRFFSMLCLSCTPERPNLDGNVIVQEWEGVSEQFPQMLTFGVVPQQSPSDIEENWSALATYLEQETGYQILIKTASSIPEFERRCSEGRYDIAYMNPYHYVVFSEKPGYQAIAKESDKKIKGIIVMRADDDRTLESLSGAGVAFPSPAAFAASLLTRAYLQSIGIAFQPVYVRSHDSVYRAVADGHYPAGGGVKKTFSAMEPEIREKLRIAWTTEGYTPHALAVHPRVSAEHIQKIQQALGALHDKEQYSSILQPLQFNGWMLAQDADWNDVRSLGLTALVP